MVAKKASEVDRFLSKPDVQFSVILIYGPDKGLVSERAQNFAKASGTDLLDPFSTIRIDAEDAAADSARIASEAHTVSMFGGKRLIWVRGQTQKNLANALQPVLDLPPTDSVVLIEAGDLKKSAPLRSRIEKSITGIALPCYQDQSVAIDRMIAEELSAANLSISNEAKQVLKQNLGGDRLASRAEVSKLCLYALDAGEIGIDEVRAVVGDASSFAIDEVVDAVATGKVGVMEDVYHRLMARGVAVFQIISALQRHFQMLLESSARMEADGQSAQSQVARARPPINFQRKDNVVRALSIWRRSAIERALVRLEGTSLETRKNAHLAQSLTSMALLAITIEAAQSRSR